jgi:hypothetical protein
MREKLAELHKILNRIKQHGDSPRAQASNLSDLVNFLSEHPQVLKAALNSFEHEVEVLDCLHR